MKPLIAALAVAFSVAAAVAQVVPPQPAPYQPSLGEIMTLQQERHIKLWYAGSAGNWPLADYEAGALQDGFDDVERMIGGDTVEKEIGGSLKALQKIIDAKDNAAFPAAYDRLSAGCNNCHRLLDHAFIAIGRPTLLPYTDQSFAPQK